MIAFAELSLRTTVDYYSKVAQYTEVLQETIFVDIVKVIEFLKILILIYLQRLAEPLALKYHCPNQSTWKIAATSFINVCKIGLPLARINCKFLIQKYLKETSEKFFDIF